MFQKYIDSLNLMDAVIAVGQDVEQSNIEWDKLYTFVHANFPAPQTTGYLTEGIDPTVIEQEIGEMAIMFTKDRATLEVELRKIPPVIAEIAFPVYIARYLLRDHRVPIWPIKATTFDEFHNRYGYMIIGACK